MIARGYTDPVPNDESALDLTLNVLQLHLQGGGVTNPNPNDDEDERTGIFADLAARRGFTDPSPAFLAIAGALQIRLSL